MKFYYDNNMGDNGVFYEDDLIKAIYSAWNIEARLYILNNSTKFSLKNIVFDPYADNEFNSELLESYGYYMEDGVGERVIKEIKAGKIIHYDWSEVIDLI